MGARSGRSTQSAEVTDGTCLSASSSTICIYRRSWCFCLRTIWFSKKAIWLTSTWPKTRFYVWSQTHHSFAFLRCFLHSQKEKKEKRNTLAVISLPSPRPSFPPSPHQLWSLVLIRVAFYTLAKQKKLCSSKANIKKPFAVSIKASLESFF